MQAKRARLQDVVESGAKCAGCSAHLVTHEGEAGTLTEIWARVPSFCAPLLENIKVSMRKILQVLQAPGANLSLSAPSHPLPSDVGGGHTLTASGAGGNPFELVSAVKKHRIYIYIY